ncbi:MAG: hypothetical protein C0407_15690 [Desulfobacca sp.]|nr:hypothetical protein [Desulfobacca sp.]
MSISMNWYRKVWANHPYSCIFLLALLVRLSVLPFIPEGIGQEHFEIAQSLLTGKGYVYEHEYPSTYLAPFYIYFLFYFLKFFPYPENIYLIKLIQVFLSALLVPILFYLGERIFDRKVGLLSAGICLCHPLFIALPATLVVDAFLIPWLFSLLFLTFLWRNSWSSWKAIMWGLLAGIALLIKMRSLAFLLPLWGWLLISNSKRSSSSLVKRDRNHLLSYRLLPGFLMIGTCLLVVAPWSIRNYQVTGSLSLEHNFGYNYWMGSNLKANGLGKYSATETRFPRPPELVERLNRANNDYERDRIFLKEGAQFWRSHPWEGVRLTVKKIVLFWWIDTVNPKTQSAFYMFPALLISFSALAGFFYPGFKWKGIGGVLLSVLALHYLSVIMTFYIARLRLSVEPVLFLYAAAFWMEVIQKGRERITS